MKKSYTIRLALLGILLVAGIFLSALFGGSESVLPFDDASRFILWQIRVPKTLTALAAGAALGAAGLILQVLFRNPLAGPYVLGISSGASLAVACALLTTSGWGIAHLPAGRTFTTFVSVGGSLCITFFILAISRKVNDITLLLIGLLISMACGAIEASLAYFADPGRLKTFVVWGMGSLSSTTRNDVYFLLPLTALSLAALLPLVKPLNGLLLGFEYASASGINGRRARFFLILVSSLLTGVATAFCGPIAFVGIAVPVISRMLFHTSRQQVHIAGSMLCGSILLLFADVAGHAVLPSGALPVNIITTFIGAPIVVWLALKRRAW